MHSWPDDSKRIGSAPIDLGLTDSDADKRLLGARRMGVLAEVGFRAARGRGAAGGADVMAALREIVPAEAYELVAHDASTSRHHSLVFEGYPPENPELGAVEYPQTESFSYVMARRGPVRINEPEGRDFVDSQYFDTYLRPHGWRAGLSAPLYLRDGRYTGMLHLSARDAEAFDEETSAVVRAVTPMLAHVTDVLRFPDPLGLPEGYRALAFTVGGFCHPLPDRPASQALAADPGIPELARDFLTSGESHRRRLWRDRAGQWRNLHLVRSAVPVGGSPEYAVLAERPCSVPYGLSPREVDVLTLIAQGSSNAEIAARLVLSVRTVTTHIDHIFTKLSCVNRVQAATTAQREGLVRAELPW